MNFYNKFVFSALAGLFLVSVFVSCEDELDTIGGDVISGEPFTAKKAVYDVFAYNKKVKAVQTNGLPIYQLGTYADPLYGKTTAYVNSQLRLAGGIANPTFGLYSQAIEDESTTDESVTTIPENETVTKVTLYIPFLTKSDALRDIDSDGVDDSLDDEPEDPSNDSDGDGLTNAQEKTLGTNPLNADTDGDGTNDADEEDIIEGAYAKQYEVDSIYGNVSVPFNFKVERSTYFLRDVDPTQNFEERQIYYSDFEFSPSFIGETLFDGVANFTDTETVTYYEIDDPDTDDDEKGTVKRRLNPGIVVDLEEVIPFFQENILDNEGQTELLSQTNFQEFIRGLYFTASGGDGDLMMLLNFDTAKIYVDYTFDKVDTNDTADDTSDDSIVEEESVYVLDINAASGNTVNSFVNDDYPVDIANKMDTGENADRIYLKGGAGSFAEIKLFDEENGRDAITEIKNNNWIINEANLVFYIDRETLDAAGASGNAVAEPPRLYLYNAEDNTSIYSFPLSGNDIPNGPLSLGALTGYDGIIETSSDGKGVKYTIRITEYINNLVVRDAENITLGLSLTSDIRYSVNAQAMLEDGEGEIPLLSVVNPFGTVLYGSNIADEDKKLQLEVYYTEIN
ncbi:MULTISPECIES: DUF4270 domain-containing protein [unclassified Cellulophaga]|uniref:DUF4270 domain-containing protein n=1 Tax=unclassified Cellulophaga TaxID=2634405 RepID=UPI0026E2C56E|nr:MULTISPECIES: DUF4270 family protein [unclassified Cellulophaga]MDO6491092.1 DUF4270 family protein [Cellulophaga sp. 2_MG-2023]MDO6495375.1 DUF4270 family protein [Cellulophaga sp. 3_MG-2023]